MDEEDGEEEIDRMTSNDAWLFPVVSIILYFTRVVSLNGNYTIIACIRRVIGTLCRRQISWDRVDQLVPQLVFFHHWFRERMEGGCLLWVDYVLSTEINLSPQDPWSDGPWGIAAGKPSTDIPLSFRGARNVCDLNYRGLHSLRFIAAFVSLSCRTPTLFLLPVAFTNAIWYHIGSSSRKFIFTDILGLSFSHNALSLLRIDSFKTGSILLSGLFFYDIWWVFGTEVVCCPCVDLMVLWRLTFSNQMIRVATSLDAPIKLLWPKSLSVVSERGYTMLGLGDIVIPGTFIALALRYDLHNYLSASERTPETKFRKPYFYAGLVAYTLGLIATTVVMHVFRAAQPALLYLR